MDEDRKIIRESRSTESINSGYDIGGMEVPFPWGMFIICIIVDVVDIVLTISVVGLLPWWIFTMFIFTPILLFYIGSRDKKFSVKGIQASIETRSSLSSVREASKLTRETKALSKAGKTAQALDKATDLAKAIQKLPKWLRGVFVLIENVPGLELLPVNSIMLFMAYKDNKSSIDTARQSMANLANNMDFKINKPITRPQGSAVSK